jgi:signal transduction histidine kinase
MRAPLRAMRGFASILEEEHPAQLDSVALSYLHRISNAASRLDQLIVDILDYSKIVRGELRLASLDLHKLVREILASYPQFDASRVDIVVEGPLPPILMRPLLLHRSSSTKAPSHRRVLHLDFATEELPGGLEWNVA